MVEIFTEYTGSLHCNVTHGPSKTVIETDAPVDNGGKGARFSPTDLVGAALSSCILTTMGIVADRDKFSIIGARATTQKVMTTQPRRIGSLKVVVTMPKGIAIEHREKLEATAHHCPVHKSLAESVDAPIEFIWQD